jgi:hypothetical protein
MRLAIVLLMALADVLVAAQAPPQTPRTPRYTAVHALKPREGVFAYARISPDGSKLVYASRVNARNPNGPLGYIETIVDLGTGNVLFSEPGIDAYWSPDGRKIIYSGNDGVTIRDNDTGTFARRVAPDGLGDYYSWAVRDGRDLILTIASRYYYLNGDKSVAPYATVAACDKIGTGERPLISKDGKRITTFVKGNIVVRSLDNCDDIFDTGIQGAKADFSWDARYIAFHAIKKEGTGYEIRIVDLVQRTVRTLPDLTGSALFPSWTQDGRLCFRYDGPDYRGFMMASGVLDVPADPLPAVSQSLPEKRSWNDIFPETPTPAGALRLVMIWAPWSAHSQDAFASLERARVYFAAHAADVSFAAAADPGSAEADITRQLSEFHVTVPRIPLSTAGLALTEARNQMPTLLLFRHGVLIDRRLGAQSFDQLRDWVAGAAGVQARND